MAMKYISIYMYEHFGYNKVTLTDSKKAKRVQVHTLLFQEEFSTIAAMYIRRYGPPHRKSFCPPEAPHLTQFKVAV